MTLSSALIGVYRRIVPFACIATLAIVPAFAQKPQKIDPARSSIRFVSKQMGAPVEGRFRRFDATIAFDPTRPEATKADFEVDLASIDLGNEEGETELRRPLWFNIEKYPVARFAVSTVKAAGPGKYEASGSLTIKGITHPVSAPVSVTEASGVRVVDGQFTLRRLQFRIGEAHWSDDETVADEVLVRFRFTFPSTR